MIIVMVTFKGCYKAIIEKTAREGKLEHVYSDFLCLLNG